MQDNFERVGSFRQLANLYNVRQAERLRESKGGTRTTAHGPRVADPSGRVKRLLQK